jgi:hypothetical protein
MVLVFEIFDCPTCKGKTFEIRHDPIKFATDLGWHKEPGYVQHFYGKCVSCGYNANLAMAFVHEFQRYAPGSRPPKSLGYYPCLAVERGYLEYDSEGKPRTIYKYECGGLEAHRGNYAVEANETDG